MKCPTAEELTREFRKLAKEDADLITQLAAAVDDPDALRDLIEARCDDTAAYVRRMYSDPYSSRIWRRTVALHAIDRALGTCGIEPIGPVDMHDGPPYEYCNTGDTYAATLVYSRDDDEITIGCFGDTVEQMENLEVPEAWDDYGRDAFLMTLISLFNELDEDHYHEIKEDETDDEIDRLWRNSCNELGIDPYIEESGGYRFPVRSWYDAAQRSDTYRAKIAAMAINHRVMEG